MSREELSGKIAEAADIPCNKGRKILGIVVDVLLSGLQNDGEVVVRGFGKFWVTTLSARKRHNPKTLEKINFPAKQYVRFAPYKSLRRAVDQ